MSYANAAVAALLGRAADEIVGRPVSEVIDNPAVQQAVAGAQARRRSRACGGSHLGARASRRSRCVSACCRRPEHPSGGDTLITIEDISQLREGQRARDNFLYHVTHELRTPLTNIHAYAETLTQPGFDDEQTRKECYNVLISETRRLSRLVEDILSISQLEVGTARLDVGEVDLARLVRQMVQDNLGTADEKGIDLTLALPPKVPKISGDKQRLSVLLNNLIGNAVKYTPASGKVHVSVEIREQRILIAVRDNGIGIGPEDQAHVFDKFYRAADDAVQTRQRHGAGAGAGPRGGPAARRRDPARERTRQGLDVHDRVAVFAQRQGGGVSAMSRILVAEDDPHILRLISMWLQRRATRCSRPATA